LGYPERKNKEMHAKRRQIAQIENEKTPWEVEKYE
jgi:hypothetical protein